MGCSVLKEASMKNSDLFMLEGTPKKHLALMERTEQLKCIKHQLLLNIFRFMETQTYFKIFKKPSFN